MTTRHVTYSMKPRALSEGAGVTVHRTIGTVNLRHLDPFLMLDHFSSDNPNDYIAGFPDHPHRGFNTLTYMLDGHMLHQDSMGNQGDLVSGGAQWMKAGSGVIHSEMPQQSEGLMRGFQLWINLPASEKMTAPGYQEYSPAAFAAYQADGVSVKVLCGEFRGVTGPISDPNTRVQYFDITLSAGAQIEVPLASELRAFSYVFEGSLQLSGSAMDKHSFATLGDGDHVTISAGEQGGRCILVAGRPIGEPIVQYGPFVMNTEQEIQLALEEYRSGRLVQQKATMTTD